MAVVLWGWGCKARGRAPPQPSVWGREFEAQHRPLAHSPAPARAPAGGGSLQKLPGASAAPWPQFCATGDGARRAAELRRLGNFSRNAVLGRARVDTCQRTVSVTVPGKRAEQSDRRPRARAELEVEHGAAANTNGLCAPGDRVGVWVAGWTGAQCLLDADTGQGLSPGGRDRIAGTGARGGRWPPQCCPDAGQTGTRRPLAARDAAASLAQGRGCPRVWVAQRCSLPLCP